MSNFSFLQSEWPAIYEAAIKSEEAVQSDARTACFYARRALELAVAWFYKHDSTLKLPYQDHLSALVHEPTFRSAVGPAIFAKIKVVKDLGNLAVHSHKAVHPLSLQREFARRVRAVEKLKTAQRTSLAQMDVLFASLQHRAFSGEL